MPLPTGKLNMLEPATAFTPIVLLPDVAPCNARVPPAVPFKPSIGLDVADHKDAPRFKIVPCVDGAPKFLSNSRLSVFQAGNVVLAVALPQTRPDSG